MITYKEILDSFTYQLSKAFCDVDIYVDDTVNDVDASCFYVQIVPLPSEIKTKETDMKNLLISIKYYQQVGSSKLDLYDIANTLDEIFVRNVKVDNTHLTINNTEANVLDDEIGYYLDYLVSLSHLENIQVEKEDYEKMQNVDIKYTL